MEINANKCEVIHFGLNNPNLEYKRSDTVLKATDVFKDLGLLVDNRLNFSKHANHVKVKCLRGMIFRIFSSRELFLYLKFYVLP